MHENERPLEDEEAPPSGPPPEPSATEPPPETGEQPALADEPASPESPAPSEEAAAISSEDYYAVLGVPAGADRQTVAEAYDRLARELQPDEDTAPSDPDRMRLIDEAFDALDDPARRADYDRSRGIQPAAEPVRAAPDRRLLLAVGLIVGGVVAIAGAVVILVLSLTGDGGADCSAAEGTEVTTEGGVTYKDITICDGAAINAGDTVEVNYIATLEDGTEFANTYTSGEVFRFLYGQAAVINGWDEGLTGMTVGSKRLVKIPADVYGEESVDPDIIPPGSTLVFVVQVEGRTPASGPVASPTPPLPTQVPTTAPSAPPEVTGQEITTDSGLTYIDIVTGSGDEAAEGDTVVVNYTGWLQADGTKFDSSLEREEPFPFTLGAGEVIAGWDEGVAGMKVGGKRRLIIPPDLAYGAAGRPPVIPENATLIFDVELLDVR